MDEALEQKKNEDVEFNLALLNFVGLDPKKYYANEYLEVKMKRASEFLGMDTVNFARKNLLKL